MLTQKDCDCDCDYDYDSDCVICFNSLKNDILAITDCGHIYHHACVYKWLNSNLQNTCPICRTSKRISILPPPVVVPQHSLITVTSSHSICCCFM